MDTNKLLGAWFLVSSIQSRNGAISHTFGEPPSGQIQYTKDGRMSAFLMNPDWAKTGKNANKETDIFFAYGGRWQLKNNEIRHFIEFCSAPPKIGTIFTRHLKFLNKNELELTTAPETSKSENVYQTTLIWKRHG